MIQLHKTQGKPTHFYARLLSKNGNLLWKTPATQYTTRLSVLNAMFSALDGFNEASSEDPVKAQEMKYMDHTRGGEPIWKIAKRRKR